MDEEVLKKETEMLGAKKKTEIELKNLERLASY